MSESSAEDIDPRLQRAIDQWIVLASLYPLRVASGIELPCTTVSDPDMFNRQRSFMLARQLCQGCPIRAHCAEVGFLRGEYGIWGGMTRQERARWAVGKGLTKPPVADDNETPADVPRTAAS